MPKAWTKKDERRYKHVRASEVRRGRGTSRAEAIAGATVNKTRKRQGRTKQG